jgi:hypothetical protein
MLFESIHTALQDFTWYDCCPLLEVAPQDLSPNIVLRALPACPHLQNVLIMSECASSDAMKNLLQLRPATELHLVLETEHWLSVADAIRRGRCNVQKLTLAMYREDTVDATEAVKAIASAIRLDRSLEHLTLEMAKDFTDEMGVALAEALTVNTTLRNITLSVEPLDDDSHNGDNEVTLGAQAYEAFSAMLLIKTSLLLELPPFDDAGGDERLHDSHSQMCIEQRLNEVGRGRLLLSSQTPRKEWVDALNELNCSYIDETPEFNISCLFSLLRLNPSVCLLELNVTTNSGL